MAQRVSSYAREPNESYETPSWVGQIIGAHLRGRCTHVWDPANGPHAKLASALRAAGFYTVATHDDFLQRRALPYDHIDAIVSNPPYGTGGRLAAKFIEHAMTLAPLVAMLLRVDFDSGKTRAHLFGDCPAFAGKIVLLDRITWFEAGATSTSDNPSDNHAWYCWYRQHRGPPTIRYARRKPC